MADEKLPAHLESFFTICDTCHGRLATACATCSQLRLAIHRYAREREAAALERAAKVCDSGVLGNGKFTAENAISWARDTEAERLAAMIRALIHKEPANG